MFFSCIRLVGAILSLLGSDCADASLASQATRLARLVWRRFLGSSPRCCVASRTSCTHSHKEVEYAHRSERIETGATSKTLGFNCLAIQDHRKAIHYFVVLLDNNCPGQKTNIYKWRDLSYEISHINGRTITSKSTKQEHKQHSSISNHTWTNCMSYQTCVSLRNESLIFSSPPTTCQAFQTGL